MFELLVYVSVRISPFGRLRKISIVVLLPAPVCWELIFYFIVVLFILVIFSNFVLSLEVMLVLLTVCEYDDVEL